MRTAKLFGNGLLALSLACWMVGCAEEEATTTDPTMTTSPSTTSPTTVHNPPAEGEEEHEHAEGEEAHDHAEGEEATEGEATEGDAASTDSLEVPEAATADGEESDATAPVESGSTTGN